MYSFKPPTDLADEGISGRAHEVPPVAALRDPGTAVLVWFPVSPHLPVQGRAIVPCPRRSIVRQTDPEIPVSAPGMTVKGQSHCMHCQVVSATVPCANVLEMPPNTYCNDE